MCREELEHILQLRLTWGNPPGRKHRFVRTSRRLHLPETPAPDEPKTDRELIHDLLTARAIPYIPDEIQSNRYDRRRHERRA